MTQVDQNTLADVLASLSEVPLQPVATTQYVSLKLNEGPHSDVINVYGSHIRCFISEERLRSEVKSADFVMTATDETVPRNQNWFRIENVTKESVAKHLNLFKKVVADSVGVVRDRQKALKGTNG